MRRECRERFPHHRGLAILTYITACAWRMCRDACWGRQLAVSFEVGGGENGPGIPGACAARNFTYLERGPYTVSVSRNENILYHSSYRFHLKSVEYDC